MSREYEKALGRKIAAERKRRGLSQKEFAGLLDRSEAWVSQVERGVRRIDRMTVLEKVADALDLPVSELAAEAPVVVSTTGEPPGAARLRLVLSTAHALRAYLGEHGVPDVPALRSQSERAWNLAHEGDYTSLADLLAELIPQAENATRAAPDADRSELFRLLATVYHCCGAALANMNEYEAAWVAVDRSVAAAERAEDPLLMAAGSFRLSIVFLGARRYAQAAEVSASAADALRPLTTDDTDDVPALALRGALTLQRAIAAARVNDADEAYAHVTRAREMAARVGPERNDHNTEFGPANVGIHEVTVAVDLGDAGLALRAADRVDPSGLSAERRTRFQIDIARAHAQRRQIPEAVAALRAAHTLSPELVRALPAVKRLMSDLVTMSEAPSEELRALAAELSGPG